MTKTVLGKPKITQLFLHTNIPGLMVSIGTKMFFRSCGVNELSSNFTGDPDTSVSCFCDWDVDPDSVNC